MVDIILEALLDTLKTIPFLFAAYLIIEFIEAKAEEKTVEIVHKAGKLGPVLGSALGVIPQCGFSAATANLYVSGLVTRGTLLAVFLSTSDEMLPILISSAAPAGFIVKVLLYKVFAAMIAGMAVDVIDRRFGLARERHIHEMCEQEGCKCEDGIFKSAVIHTLKIAGFLLLVNLALSIVIEYVGPDNLGRFILNRPVAGQFLSGLIGLIPNCAASVVITQLYLQGSMSAGAMLAGLLTGSGVGLLVLFRMDRHSKEKYITLIMLYISGILFGILADLLPIF
ncbi:MAG: arsenic efflux protein [Oscillospiraceae bacterium]|nr:arsenic efflux protein [Oscillospiraceae bacterium]